jgi:hypothetical protein
MQSFLSQLAGKTVKELHTLDNSNGKFSSAEIVSAENYILHFISNGQKHYIPVHLLVGIELWSDDAADLKLSSSDKDSENSGSSCCEESIMRSFLQPLAGGSKIDFDTLSEQLNDVTGAAVSAVVKGLALLTTRDIAYVVALNGISDISNITST